CPFLFMPQASRAAAASVPIISQMHKKFKCSMEIRCHAQRKSERKTVKLWNLSISRYTGSRKLKRYQREE
ncbi:MAG: hypothetical protein J5722_09040, partial [Oscillospiraceae bacterium]|nr:hypothetical protein [Oscillospiraceae bacterium]